MLGARPLHFSCYSLVFFFFFFNDTATTEIYTLSLHDALPISLADLYIGSTIAIHSRQFKVVNYGDDYTRKALSSKKERSVHHILMRSEEHTSELQSHVRISYAVFCLKKKKKTTDRKSTRLNSRTNYVPDTIDDM